MRISELSDGSIVTILSFADLRYNWWGADNGPKVYRVDRNGYRHLIRDVHGEEIYLLWGFPLFRPWATEPIPDAGVN